MPEALTKNEVKKEQDPSVSKQYDDASADVKFKDFYAIADKLKIAMLATSRPGLGPVARSMAIAKRTGPDFLFLSNANSTKFGDIESNKETTVILQDSSSQDWVSVTGDTVTASSQDPRIKEIYSKDVSAWFGDLKDGVHDGGPEDPRMKLIEVRAKYIVYWKHTTGALGFAKEVGLATLTGGVAQTGVLREMQEAEIKEARSKDSALSSN